MAAVGAPVHINGPMPLPSSLDAPRFDGTNLREFLTNYTIATEEVGWTNEQRCRRLPLYANTTQRDFIEALEEVTTGVDWNALQDRLKEYYHETRQPRFTRRDLETFVQLSSMGEIRTRKQFADYNREFQLRVQYLRPEGTLSVPEKNLYYWRGIPKPLQLDIFFELKTTTPGMNLTEPQPMSDIRSAALRILNHPRTVEKHVLRRTKLIKIRYHKVPIF